MFAARGLLVLTQSCARQINGRSTSVFVNVEGAAALFGSATDNVRVVCVGCQLGVDSMACRLRADLSVLFKRFAPWSQRHLHPFICHSRHQALLVVNPCVGSGTDNLTRVLCLSARR
jgi:hypothetical protein